MACVKLIHTSNLTQNFWIHKILHNVDVHIAGIFNYLLLAAALFFYVKHILLGAPIFHVYFFDNFLLFEYLKNDYSSK